MTASQHMKRGLVVAIGLLIAVVAVEAVLLYHHALEAAPVNADAGYYLSTVERYAEGWVPHRDLHAGYTPLGLYILLGARLVVGSSIAYEGYAAVTYLFLLLAALLVWRLARRLGAGRLESAGAAALLLILGYASEGIYITLEPFVAVFTLLAVHACLTARDHAGFFVLAGCCVGLAFLSKQYGLAALAPVGLYALATGGGLGSRLRRGALVVLGFLLPIAVLLLAYWILFGVAPADIVGGWGGRRYAWWGPLPAMEIVEEIAWPNLLVLVWLPFVALAPRHRRDAGFWLVLLTALVMLTPLAVRSYRHYLILSLPFLCVLGALVVAWGRKKRWRVIAVTLTAVASLVVSARSSHRDFRRHAHDWDRDGQMRVAEALREHVPPGSTAQVIGGPEQWLNYVADLRPPLPARTGYGFPSSFTDETAAAVFERVPVVIGRTGALDADARWRMLLASNGFVLVDVIGDDFEVHRRVP